MKWLSLELHLRFLLSNDPFDDLSHLGGLVELRVVTNRSQLRRRLIWLRKSCEGMYFLGNSEDFTSLALVAESQVARACDLLPVSIIYLRP
jgi:hypothetical protein